ncbi:MAG: sigma-70 family RNA polymerase sigma factor [Verrucomicrobiota bacterium]
METIDQPDPEDFLKLLNEHEEALRLYLHTLIPDRAEAEDLLQATRIVLWREFPTFEAGTNFVGWARRIAFHQVLNHRRKRERRATEPVDPAFLESVAEEIDRQSHAWDDRTEALHRCLAKLPAKQRRLVALRYEEDLDIDAIAAKTERSDGAVYRLLSRIRAALHQCIDHQLNLSRNS